MDFEQLVAARHSAINFDESFKMTESDFEKIFNLTKTAPSAYNLQFANYLVITDAQQKEELRALNYGQYKIHSASAAVILLGDRHAIEQENAEKIYGPMKMLKMIDEQTYEQTLELIQGYADGLKSNDALLKEELVRNTTIHATQFMLAAKHLGFDTCPMHIHNIADVRQAFNIPAHLEPIMLITIGKSVDKIRPRGYRKPVGEFVQFNRF